MTIRCNSCGAEITEDAVSCWVCKATGKELNGRAPPFSIGKGPLLIALAVVLVAAVGGGAWWAVLREGAPFSSLFTPGPTPTPQAAPEQPMQSAEAVPAAKDARMKLPEWMRPGPARPGGASASPAPAAPAASVPAASAREVPAEGEALLIADPIDGPFFVTFKQLMPADYKTMMAPLLAQTPDPQKEHDRFDELLSDQLEAFQTRNARAIVAADTPVLAEMAANMQRAMRTPEICHAAMQGTYQPLPLANTEARRIAAASNLSLIRAVASGRTAGIARVQPSPTQLKEFNKDLQRRLTTQQWTTFEAGGLGDMAVSDQCIVMAAYWSVIAGYPPEEAAQWTAYQMTGLIQ